MKLKNLYLFCLLAGFIFSANAFADQRYVCNLSNWVDESSQPLTVTREFNADRSNLNMKLSDGTELKVYKHKIIPDYFLALELKHKDVSSSALFAYPSPHPFLSAIVEHQVIQAQCWLQKQ